MKQNSRESTSKFLELTLTSKHENAFSYSFSSIVLIIPCHPLLADIASKKRHRVVRRARRHVGPEAGSDKK